MSKEIVLQKAIKGRVLYEVRKWDPLQKIHGPWKILDLRNNLKTNRGADVAMLNLGSYNTLGGTAAPFIALSQDSSSITFEDTTLTGEIATGGLSRVGGSFTKEPDTLVDQGSGSYTLINTFTASSIFEKVQKSGVFTAVSAGTMVFENTFTASTLQINDQLKVTWEVTT